MNNAWVFPGGKKDPADSDNSAQITSNANETQSHS